jgi:hypothetical protein
MSNEWINPDKLIDLIVEKVVKRLSETGSGNGYTPETQRLLDVNGLAEALNVPKSWIYDRTRKREREGIPHYKGGNRVSSLLLTNVSESEVRALNRELNMAKNIGMSLKKFGETLNCQ